MSVTILPYIDEVNKTGSTITESTSTEARTDAVYDSFREVLASAERAQQAMAVDAILAAQSSGSISPETVQKLLGFNPAPNIPVADSQNVSTGNTAAVTSGSQTNATSSGNTSSSSSTSLDAYFEEASEKYNVDVKLLKAIAHAESNFNPNATSSSGAMGVMQLMPHMITLWEEPKSFPSILPITTEMFLSRSPHIMPAAVMWQNMAVYRLLPKPRIILRKFLHITKAPRITPKRLCLSCHHA